jgi:hypothetical protein
MTHPIIECKVGIEKGIEAHLDELQKTLTEKMTKLLDLFEQGMPNDRIFEMADLSTDIKIIRDYIKKFN